MLVPVPSQIHKLEHSFHRHCVINVVNCSREPSFTATRGFPLLTFDWDYFRVDMELRLSDTLKSFDNLRRSLVTGPSSHTALQSSRKKRSSLVPFETALVLIASNAQAPPLKA